MSARLRIQLLGTPSLTADEVAVRLYPARAAALVWFLASHPGRPFMRQAVAELLWDDGSDREKRLRLNTMIYRLRRLLPVWPIADVEGGLCWKPPMAVFVDVHRLNELMTLKAKTDSAVERDRLLQEALALWRGPFLEGFAVPQASGFMDWLQAQQQHWERVVLDSCWELVQLKVQSADWDSVLRYGRWALAIDYWQERFHRSVIQALWCLGERAAALAHFDTWASRLHREWQAEPDGDTLALVAMFRQQATLRPEPGQMGPTAASSAARPPQVTAPAAVSPRPTAWEPPWVGRQREQRSLLTALQASRHGGPRLVIVRGIAGIGKSRLLRRVVETVQAPDSDASFDRALWTTCFEPMVQVPYAAWACLLRAGFDESCWKRLPRVFQDTLQRLLPEVASVDFDPSRDVAVEHTRWLCEGITRYWASLPGTTLLILDDLHWADPSSWTVLAYLVTADVPSVTVLASLRQEDGDPRWHNQVQAWSREQVAVVLPLEPLDPSDVDQMVSVLAPYDRPAWAEALYRHTAGHPLLIAALFREALESGRSRIELPDTRDGPPAVAPSVNTIVSEWLQRLSRPALALAQALAIFPVPPLFGLLHRVAQLPESVALEAWGELRHRALVREASPGDPIAQPYGSFAGALAAFQHELVRQAVASQMSRVEWSALHGRVVALVGAASPNDSLDAACLAYHAEEAGLWDAAADWALVSADAAERLGAYAEATQWLERASRHLERLPRTQDRRRRWVDIRLRLALLAWHTAPQQAKALVEQINGAVDEPPDEGQRVAWWTRRVEGWLLSGRLPHAIRMVERLLPSATRLGRPALEGMVRLRLAQLHGLAGELRLAVEGFAAAAPLLEAGNQPLWYAQCLGTWASTLATLGEFSQAQQVLQRLEAWPPAQEHPMVSLVATLHTLTVFTQQELWATAVETGRRLLAGLRAGDHDALEYIALTFLGLPVTAMGDPAGGVDLLQRAVALGHRLGMRILLDRAYAYLAEAWTVQGQFEAARKAALAGLQIAREDGYPVGEALNQRALAVLTAPSSEADQALERIRAAFAAMGALAEVARCHRLLGTLAMSTSLRARHQQLGRTWYAKLGMPWPEESAT